MEKFLNLLLEDEHKLEHNILAWFMVALRTSGLSSVTKDEFDELCDLCSSLGLKLSQDRCQITDNYSDDATWIEASCDIEGVEYSWMFVEMFINKNLESKTEAESLINLIGFNLHGSLTLHSIFCKDKGFSKWLSITDNEDLYVIETHCECKF